MIRENNNSAHHLEELVEKKSISPSPKLSIKKYKIHTNFVPGPSYAPVSSTMYPVSAYIYKHIWSHSWYQTRI